MRNYRYNPNGLACIIAIKNTMEFQIHSSDHTFWFDCLIVDTGSAIQHPPEKTRDFIQNS